MPSQPSQQKPASQKPEKYARLRAEIKAPYRGLRKFVYIAFGASGLIGAVVFLAQLAAGQDVATVLPNFALQLGVVALMVWLFRIDRASNRNSD
ncbi:hypothetical protein BST81_14600 [Leptolyngbya sp. 'hensonii']|nr:hypothetical protein BST81_14600 [Leptolyngbya sp. 'hensonii']